MHESEMSQGMLAELVVKQVRRDLVQIEKHPRCELYWEDMRRIEILLSTLEATIPHRRKQLREQLADLNASELDYIDELRALVGAVEGKLDPPEDMGTRRE